MQQIIVTLMFLALCTWYALYLLKSVKNGELYLPGAKIRRYREPVMFWSAVVIMLTFTIGSAVGALVSLFRLL